MSAAKKKWLLHAKVEKTWPLYLISWPLHLMLTNATKMNYKWRCSRVHMWQAPTFFSGRGSAKTARSAAVLVQVDCDTMPRRVKKNHGLCCLGVYGSRAKCTRARDGSGKPVVLNQVCKVCHEQRCKRHHCACARARYGTQPASTRGRPPALGVQLLPMGDWWPHFVVKCCACASKREVLLIIKQLGCLDFSAKANFQTHVRYNMSFLSRPPKKKWGF